MLARKDPVVKRRDLSKAFAEAGGGEISIALISIAGICYGANYRQGVEEKASELEKASTVREADGAHLPTMVAIGGQVRLKQGERSVTMAGQPLASDLVDLLWLRDESTGELLGAAENKKRVAAPELSKTLRVGDRVRPYVHCEGEPGVVWRGPVFEVA